VPPCIYIDIFTILIYRERYIYIYIYIDREGETERERERKHGNLTNGSTTCLYIHLYICTYMYICTCISTHMREPLICSVVQFVRSQLVSCYTHLHRFTNFTCICLEYGSWHFVIISESGLYKTLSIKTVDIKTATYRPRMQGFQNWLAEIEARFIPIVGDVTSAYGRSCLCGKAC